MKLKSTLQFLVCFTLTLFSSLHAHANWDCSKIMNLRPDLMDAVRPDFVHRPRTYTYTALSTPIDNQCQIGSCWIYGTDAEVERHMISIGLPKANLSEAYLTIKAMQLRAALALDYPGQTVSEGGWYAGALWLMETQGAMPESAFTPRVNFMKDKAPARLIGFLNARIAQFHNESAMAKARGASDEQIASLKERARQDELAIIEAYTGPIPETFKYNKKTYTPLEFAQLILPQNQRTVKIAIRQTQLEPALLAVASAPKLTNPIPSKEAIKWKTDASFIATPVALANLIANRIQEGKGVVAAIEINRSYIDKQTGIMSINAFSNPEGFIPTSSAYRAGFDQMFGGHLIIIVGIDIDSAGRVVKFKIKNSWGTESGDKGFYHMYADYAQEYLKAIYLSITPEELAAFEQEVAANTSAAK